MRVERQAFLYESLNPIGTIKDPEHASPIQYDSSGR